MATTTKSKKQQKSHHAAYAKRRNRSIQQKQQFQKINEFGLLAIELGNIGRYEEAIQVFEKALAINPNDVNILYNYGVALNKSGRDEDAIRYYEYALTFAPNNFKTLYNCGASLEKTGHYEDAMRYYERVLTINPQHVETLCNYGNILDKLGCYEDAIRYYERALAINPQHIETLYNYGNVLDDLRLYEDAISYYERALAIKPKDVRVICNYGVTLNKLGRYEDAIRYHEGALEIEPHNLNTLNNYGIALEKSGRYENAMRYYERALAIDPNSVVVLCNYGGILGKSGRNEDAIPYFERALAIDPNSVVVLCNYGGILGKSGRNEDAIPYFERALSIDPKSIEAHYNYGISLVKSNRYQDAITQFEQALKIPSVSKPNGWFGLYLVLGILYYRCQSPRQGDAYFNLAIERSNDKDATKLRVAQEMFAQDHYSEKGAAILQEITETSPYYQKAFESLKSHLSPKAFFDMFNTRPDEENAIKDTGLLNRALYHKIANEIAILKETVHLLLSDYHINEPKLTDILARIDAILEGVKQRRAQEKADVEAIPAKDYDAILATISKTAHDISDFVNNKLAAIEERIRLILAQPSENDVLLKKLNKMLERIKTSQNALNDLKSVNEGIKLHDSHFKIAELFEQWQQTPSFRHAAISLDIRNGDEIFYGDVEKIKSFLKELIENAVRHNPNKADLQIRITSEDILNPEVITQSILSGERKFLFITVSDNGQGIPLKNKDWVFVPLKTTSNEGSGLGLFIIRRTLKEMRGQILETGTNGACFEIYIPYREGDEAWNK